MELFELKKVILKSGYKQQFIAQRMNLNPVIFSKKLNGYLHFEKNEQKELSRLLGVNFEAIFPSHDNK